MRDELYHHGVKGMRWGVRRYQPYPDGKSGKEVGEAAKASKRKRKLTKEEKKEIRNRAFSKSIKTGKGKENLSPAEKATRDVESASRSASSITRRASDAKNKRTRQVDPEIKKLSDNELRQRINRIEMERKYNSLTQGDTRNGFDRTTDILDTVGDVASVAGGVLSTYLTIRGLKG